MQFGPAVVRIGGGGQGVGSPPPSNETVPAKAVVSLVEIAEQRPKNNNTTNEIRIFMEMPPRAGLSLKP